MQEKIYIKTTLVILISFIGLKPLKSQSGCQDLLSASSQAYTEGKYELVIKLLKDKLQQCEFTKLEIEQATKILSASYLKLEEYELASQLVFKMLKNNPIYQIQTTSDPPPFIAVFNSFKVDPKIKIGLNLGQYHPLVIAGKSHQVLRNTEFNTKLKVNFGIHASSYVQYMLSDKLSVLMEPGFSFISYHENVDYANIASITYSEKSPSLHFPLSIGFKIYQQNNISVSLFGGAQESFVIHTVSSLSYSLPGAGRYNASGFENVRRKKFYTGLQTALKCEYNMTRYNFNFQVDYGGYFNNYELAGKNYSDNTLLTDYNYYPTDFKLQYLNFKVGVSYILKYKVEKKYKSE